MVFALLSFFFLNVSSSFAAENCVEGLQGLKANANLHAQVNQFGGIDGLAGVWKLKGILGALAKSNVEFQVKDGNFWVAINREPLRQVFLCTGDKAEVLKMKVSKSSKNDTILLKAGASNQLQIAAVSSGWHFMKFKRISAPAKSKAAEFIASEEK